MACMGPMTAVLFVGFGVGAWAAAAAPSNAVNVRAIKVRMRPTPCLFERAENTTRLRQGYGVQATPSPRLRRAGHAFARATACRLEGELDVGEDPARIQNSRGLVEERRRQHAAVADVVVAIREILRLHG